MSGKTYKLTSLIAFVLCGLIVLGGLGIGACVKLHYDSRIDNLTRSIESLQMQINESKNNDNLNFVNLSDFSYSNLDLPEIASKASVSVVGITVTVQVKDMGRLSTQILEQSSQGSGIIYNTDGYIITSFHVVESLTESDSAQIEVYLADGRSAIAKYIGDDNQNDLAVIQIDLDNLPVAQFGSSGELGIGEFAMAIGNPLGMDLAGTVTVGIISGIDRNVKAENAADSLIQTDAAINPGNSGGALVNNRGQVIGINTIKIASAVIEGLGFAIPIDYALPIVESIIEHRYVAGRPATGINGTEINATTAHFHNVPQGLLVTDVDDGSAAEELGIQRNDIILELGGQTVTSISDINNILRQYRVGDAIPVKFYRNGQTLTVMLTLLEGK